MKVVGFKVNPLGLIPPSLDAEAGGGAVAGVDAAHHPVFVDEDEGGRAADPIVERRASLGISRDHRRERLRMVGGEVIELGSRFVRDGGS